MNRPIDPAMLERINGTFAYKRPPLQARIVDILGRFIAEGRWPPDSPLPVETELAGELNVSRTVLREAIKGLAAKGMIESRPKIGTRVRPRRHWNMIDPDVLKWCLDGLSDHQSLRQLFELRIIVEPAAAELAASRRSDEQLRRLKRAYHGMALSDTAEENILADLDFHLIILEASGNELLLSLGNVISSTLVDIFQLGQSTWDAEGNQWIGHHEQVMLAIEAADGPTARRIMHELLSESLDNAQAASERQLSFAPTGRKRPTL